jgi:hypothetical protein
MNLGDAFEITLTAYALIAIAILSSPTLTMLLGAAIGRH